VKRWNYCNRKVLISKKSVSLSRLFEDVENDIREGRRKLKEKKDEAILKWLTDETGFAHSEASEAQYRAEELQEALDRFRSKGTLPRDIRYEYNLYKRNRK